MNPALIHRAAAVLGEPISEPSDGTMADALDTMTAVVSGAGSNVVTLSFTDTETAALTATKYLWTLWVTRGADKRPWLAGDVYMGDGTNQLWLQENLAVSPTSVKFDTKKAALRPTT